MGLASAMSTALTGLTASETSIDVVGNNLANSNTVGFKSSSVTFATQFLQTESLGAAPTTNSGGLNPRQTGLGTMVAQIAPNFQQGTVEATSSATDLAIQGDGFFIVQGSTGAKLYTRNGVFTTNGQNQLVTSTGNRLMGYGVDKNFQINTSQLVPLEIPLGTATVAKATANVVMQGTLTPTGTVANTAQVVQSTLLIDGSKSYPPSDTMTAAAGAAGVLSGKYQYYITYANGATESRPDELPTSSGLLDNQSVDLSNIPIDDSVIPGTDTLQWSSRRIYRSVNDQAGDTNYYLVGELPNEPGAATTFNDNLTDAEIRATGHILNMSGPAAGANTALSDVVTYDGTDWTNAFPATGTLQFTGTKGGRTLTTKSLDLAGKTLQDLANFMQQATGIQKSPGSDEANPIPVDAGTGYSPGVTITSDGRLRIVSNNGTDSAVTVGLSGMQVITTDVPPVTQSVSMPFSTVQSAAGQTCVADMIAYDSLGIPLSVRVTAVLQEVTSTYTAYRWFADSGQNDPSSGTNIAVGTGVIKFDGQGNFLSVSNNTVSIDRANEPSVKPLQFALDFTQLSGLSASSPTLSVSRQDGSAPGSLSSFQIGEDGKITGVFSNGITRDLGQIRLARFANPTGLEQEGQNLYATGVNSGLPIEGNPGGAGTGSIVAGAVELSNTDIGGNMIDLILASTMYQSNTRVITTAQQLFSDLLSVSRG